MPYVPPVYTSIRNNGYGERDITPEASNRNHQRSCWGGIMTLDNEHNFADDSSEKGDYIDDVLIVLAEVE
jgi:hypothetical protein